MIADGLDIPRRDFLVQWPEGLRPWRELTVLMELVHGTLFRWLSVLIPGVTLDLFLVVMISLNSALAGLIVYAAAGICGVSRRWGVMLACFFLFTPAAYSRVGDYELEHFAGPLFLLSVILFMKMVQMRRITPSMAVLATLSAALSVASWHVSQFLFLGFTIASALMFPILPVSALSQWRRAFLPLISGIVIAGVLSPIMRETGLLTSTGFIAMIGLFALFFFGERYRFSKRIRVVVLAVLTFFCGVLFLLLLQASSGGDYGHVWHLIYGKLIFLGRKPISPADMPWDARILWTGAFNTMSTYVFLYQFRILLIPLMIGLVMFLTKIITAKDRIAHIWSFLFLNSLIFAIAAVLIQRLSMFACFFFCLCAMFAGWSGERLPATARTDRKGDDRDEQLSRRKPSPWLTVLLISLAIIQIHEALKFERTALTSLIHSLAPDARVSRPFLHPTWRMQLMNWIRENVARNDAILTNFELGPTVLVCTGRPIVLQPKFENDAIRRKVKDFLMVLFHGTEEQLAEFMDRNDTRYFLYPINNFFENDADSLRYLTDCPAIGTDSLLYRLHFEPEACTSLSLVFRNGFYSVFRRIDGVAGNTGCEIPSFPVYEKDLFGRDSDGDGHVDEQEHHARLEAVALGYRTLLRMDYLEKRGEFTAAYSLGSSMLPRVIPDVLYHQTLERLALKQRECAVNDITP